MKQVNMTITDEEYTILVKETGKRIAKTGKLMTVTTLAHELLLESIAALHKANDNPVELGEPDASIKEDKIDNKESIKKPEAPSDRLLKEGEQPSKVSKSSFDFSALDM